MKILTLVTILLSIGILHCSVDTFLQDKEDYVTNLQGKAQSLINLRCSSSATRTCATCSYDSCSGTLPDMICETEFTSSQECADCLADTGAVVSWDTSTVRFPYGTSYSDDDYIMVCATTDLDEKFIENSADAGTTGIAWQFLGTYNGMFRMFPAQAWSATGTFCDDYDPRYRPWYVGATTPSKNLVIVMDTSGSMQSNSPTRLELAKMAAIAVVTTLGTQDWIGFVEFNTDAEKFSSTLQRATSSIKDSFIDQIDNLLAVGKTNYADGFTAAYEIFDQAADDEYGQVACDYLILFLTDGLITEGYGEKFGTDEYDASVSDIQDLYDLIDTLDTGVEATIFTYTMGDASLKEAPHHIACTHKGIWTSIPDGSTSVEVVTAMAGYYQYLAAGTEVTNVVWSEPYEDASGLGTITTASLPIYIETEEVKKMVGVVGVDILIADLETQYNYEVILQGIIDESTISCPESSLTFCQMEELRGDDSSCYDLMATLDGEAECDEQEGYALDTCGFSVENNPFCGTDARTDEYAMCCIGDTFNCFSGNLSFIFMTMMAVIVSFYIV